MKTIAFFNHKGGVGKTTLVYHLAWSYADLGLRVVAVDLDPQSNLTAFCLPEEELAALWPDAEEERRTIYGSVLPIMEGLGDVREPSLQPLGDRIALLTGDILLSRFEARLSIAWPQCLDGDRASFRQLTAFHRLLTMAARAWEADVLLIDVGPNVGAITRSALIASEWVVTPLGADLFSVQGLRNLGPTLREWRQGWTDRLRRNPLPELAAPDGRMDPAGYVVLQPAFYGGQVTSSYSRWLDKIPREYSATLPAPGGSPPTSVESDPFCLGVLRHYRSLMPLAQEARKPIFHLGAADGALGAHSVTARVAGRELERLARRLAEHAGLGTLPLSLQAAGGEP